MIIYKIVSHQLVFCEKGVLPPRYQRLSSHKMKIFWSVCLTCIAIIGQLLASDSVTPVPETELDAPSHNKSNVTKTWGTIFPGTKWCGKGNKAKHEEDFGRYIETDKCCKNHDRCPDKIKKGQSKYGLYNNGSTTLLSCSCDQIFYDCLKNIRSTTSRTVGVLYFDLLNRKCFAESPMDSGKYKWQRPRRFSKFVKLVSKVF